METTSYTANSYNAQMGLISSPAYWLFLLAAYVITGIFLGKIFKKAGVESWIAWVPFYNSWKMFQIGGQQGYWTLFAFIPLLGVIPVLVFYVMAALNIGRKLGKSDMYVVLALFLSPVWMILLGTDKAAWDESKGAPRKDGVATPPQFAPAATGGQPVPPTTETSSQPVTPATNNQVPPIQPPTVQ